MENYSFDKKQKNIDFSFNITEEEFLNIPILIMEKALTWSNQITRCYQSKKNNNIIKFDYFCLEDECNNGLFLTNTWKNTNKKVKKAISLKETKSTFHCDCTRISNIHCDNGQYCIKYIGAYLYYLKLINQLDTYLKKYNQFHQKEIDYKLPPEAKKIADAYLQTEKDLSNGKVIDPLKCVKMIQQEYNFPKVIENKLVQYITDCVNKEDNKMKNYNDFLKFAESQGININDIYKEKGDTYNIVSFGEETDNGAFNVTLVIYDDDNVVEIYIRKPTNIENILDVFVKVNELNAEYMGVNFFVGDSVINLKSLCNTAGDIEVALKQMVNNMQIAKEVFAKF